MKVDLGEGAEERFYTFGVVVGERGVCQSFAEANSWDGSCGREELMDDWYIAADIELVSN